MKWFIPFILALSFVGITAVPVLAFAPKLTAENARTTNETQQQLLFKLTLYEETLKAGLSYKDFSRLRAISGCESNFEQYKNGKVHVGDTTPTDHGGFMISLIWHAKTARAMGLNVDKMKDNVDYAIFLYKKNGVSDWKASRRCWTKIKV